MRSCLLLFPIVLLSFTQVFAQYGDAYHRADIEKINKDRKTYIDAYIDALRYNRNTSTKTSTSTNSGAADAARQLADIFASRAGRETSTQKDERLKKEQANYELYVSKKAEEDRISADYWKDDMERRNRILSPLNTLYKEAGFTPYEANILAYSHLGDRLSENKEKHIYSFKYVAQSTTAKEALILFNQRLNTASFEELFDLISDFNIAANTALMSLQKLEKRFPEKKAVIGASYLMHTASFWGNYDDNTYRTQYDEADKNTQRIMLDIFRIWLNTYPDAAMMVASKAKPDRNPLRFIAEQAVKEKEFEEAGKVAILALQAPIPWTRNWDKSRDAIRGFASILWYPKKDKLQFFTASDIKEIAANHDVPARIIIEWLSDEDTDRYSSSRFRNGEYIHTFRPSYTDKGYDKILKELGEEGDGDALNTYAYGLAYGVSKGDPKEAIELWKKAADMGSYWAMYNLLSATGWGFKWYDKRSLPVAKEKLKTFTPATRMDKHMYTVEIALLRSF